MIEPKTLLHLLSSFTYNKNRAQYVVVTFTALSIFILKTGASFEERLQTAYALLESVPLIDGHNDLPYNIRKFVHNQLSDFE